MKNKRISMNEKQKKLLDFMKQYPKIDIRFGYERQNKNVLKEYSISRDEFEEIQKYYKYMRQNKGKLTEEEIAGLQEACIDPIVFGNSSEIEKLSEILKEKNFELFRHVETELFLAVKKYGTIENLKKVYMSGEIDNEDYSNRRLANKLISLDNPELAKEVAINYNYRALATKLGIKVDNIDNIKKLVASLTPKEQEVISYRNGLESGKVLTIEETGREFSVTRERIRQIEAKAYRKLRYYNDRMSKESELSDLQEDRKCDEALELVEKLDKNKEQEEYEDYDEYDNIQEEYEDYDEFDNIQEEYENYDEYDDKQEEIERIKKEYELEKLQEEDRKCDEALELVEKLDKNKEQEGQTQGDD